LIEPGLKQHSGRVSLWQLAVQAHLAGHDIPAAERALQQCRRLGPQSEDTHLLQAYCALQKGQREQAAAIARDLLEHNSNDLTVRVLLASALKDDPASLAEAAAQYRAIIALEPGNEWARQQLALLSKRN
jgi:predicted Zn-dependent protease